VGSIRRVVRGSVKACEAFSQSSVVRALTARLGWAGALGDFWAWANATETSAAHDALALSLAALRRARCASPAASPLASSNLRGPRPQVRIGERHADSDASVQCSCRCR
jgi:hypothetical protein